MKARERYNALYPRGQAQVAVATLKRLGTFEDGMAARHLTPEEMDQIAEEDWPGPEMFKPLPGATTYGDISAKLATSATQQMLNDCRRLRMMIGTPGRPITRWQRFKTWLRWSNFRWWLAEKLRDLAYWIEP